MSLASKSCAMLVIAASLSASTAVLASAQALRVRLADEETRQPLVGVLVSAIGADWIDGSIADIVYLNELSKDEIALIEVYTSAAGAPLQFAGTRTNCGVVLVWRKRFINP